MSQFVDYLHEVFEEFGPISIRRMFGGHGLFFDNLMFALVNDDVLYMKADEQSSAYFEDLQLGKFAYNKAGKIMHLSYYQAPEEIYDDREAATLWARRAFDAALRANKPKKKTRKKAPKKVSS
ncbi:MAG: DNA transformation protein [Parasphingorhabdus sp.]|jgi:DNA transformation protein